MDNSTWHYKIPTSMDVPADLRTEFYDSGNNPNGVLGSKATGEPSVLAGCSVLFALRMAITSARADAGLTDWFQFGKLSIFKVFSIIFVIFQMGQPQWRISRLPVLSQQIDLLSYHNFLFSSVSPNDKC